MGQLNFIPLSLEVVLVTYDAFGCVLGMGLTALAVTLRTLLSAEESLIALCSVEVITRAWLVECRRRLIIRQGISYCPGTAEKEH
jgi:hypothetical protein